MRGTPPDGTISKCILRITPARAGNTRQLLRQRRFPQDHPRACGEHFLRRVALKLVPGSPPRVRGTRLFSECSGMRGRITPARAGNTYADVFAAACNKDHPRACGEHAQQERRLTHWIGSPPRVRGTPSKMLYCDLKQRITPARAGNTPCCRDRSRLLQDHPRACGEH